MEYDSAVCSPSSSNHDEVFQTAANHVMVLNPASNQMVECGNILQSNVMQGVEQNQLGGAFVDLTQGETAHQNNYPLEGVVHNEQVAVCGEIQQQLVGEEVVAMETPEEVVAMETQQVVGALETQQEVVVLETQQETPQRRSEAQQAYCDVTTPIRIRKPSQESSEYPNLNDDVIMTEVQQPNETAIAEAERVDDVMMDIGMLDPNWMDPGLFCPEDVAREVEALMKKDADDDDVTSSISTSDVTRKIPSKDDVAPQKYSPEYIESLEARKENLTSIKNHHVGQYLWETGKFRLDN